MMLSLKLLRKLSTPNVCSWCQQISTLQHFSKAASSGSLLLAQRHDVQRPLVAHVAQHQGMAARPKRVDPIRPVSDKLLRSLAKRHQDSFAMPVSGFSPSDSSALTQLSTEELIRAIHSTSKHGPSRNNRLKDIEMLLVKRLYKMSLASALQACHAFYTQQHNFYLFLSQTLTTVDELFDELSPSASEITHLLLYIFIHGNAPGMLFQRVEDYMLEHLDKFHINDLGVICVGFFRGNSRISSQDLLDAVADKLLKELNSLEPFLLPDFMKMFRHASFIKVSFYESLAERLVKSHFLSRYRNTNPLMHIAFTYASIPVRHAQLFESLFVNFERVLTRQPKVRTKDISKFVWACGSLQYRPADYERRFQQLVQRFEASSDSKDFPESMAELLTGLVYLDVFPTKLFDKCLSTDNTTRLMAVGAGREKSHQLLLLNESVKLERPEYTGRLVCQSQMQEVMQHRSVWRDLEAELQTRVGLLALLSSLQHILGADKVHCLFPLLHFKTAVVELQYSSQHGFLSFPSPAARPQTSSPGRRDSVTRHEPADHSNAAPTGRPGAEDPQKLRLAILVSSNNQYALNDGTHILGQLHTMKRQLQKTSYTLLEICPEDALHLEVSSQEERCRHLSSVLNSALQINISLPGSQSSQVMD